VVTGLPISKHNCEQLVDNGRGRWKIENEGFNAQKNHGYGLEHLFSKDYTAMKNHYLLIQIGHMIAQFVQEIIHLWKAIKAPSYQVFQIIKQSFLTTPLVASDILSITQRRQYRFH